MGEAVAFYTLSFFILGLAVLVVTSPLLALAALAIKFDDRGPVLYRQRRVGRGGEEFELPEVAAEAPKVVDLMAALEASVKAAKSARQRHPTSADGGDAPAERTVRKTAARKVTPARKRKSA